MILGLDLGTSCGWAVGDIAPAAHLLSGVWNLAPSRGDSPGVRFLKLRANLNWIKAAYGKPALVAYELPHHRGSAWACTDRFFLPGCGGSPTIA